LEHLNGPHHQVLEVLCVNALKRGDLSAAWRLADRRCRIRPAPDPHSYVLRAEALYRMGERAAAVFDLATALQIAPEDIAANRRMLVWGRPLQRVAAAKTLIDCDRDTRMLRKAIAVLRKRGQTDFAGVRVRESLIEGWAVWQGSGSIRVSVADEAECSETAFSGDMRHPLANESGNAVSFKIPRKSTPQFVSVVRGGHVLLTTRTTGDAGVAAPIVTAGNVTVDPDVSVTIVVPVYGDYDATKACLGSLLGQIDSTGRHRVMIVNDASPDRRIHELLDSLAPREHLQVFTNAKNLGFVGAVNRALGEVPSGDVILLNADTIIPPALIERLSSVARSSPDIGTATPLSNNGEFTSFPVPNRSNVAGSYIDVANIDRIAARVNAGVIVDLPNGIGFCLYVTRSCLDSVGLLSESYHRGYLEDVDFCLRARAYGFRNVCATSIYVGHAGSRSFGKQKRSLVVRNLEVIERRFPAYRAECAEFMFADPLKAARQAIEVCLMDSQPPRALLVTGSGAVADVARHRARQLLAGEMPAVLILEIQHCSDRIIAKLRDVRDGIPQSLEFCLTIPDEATELLRLLRRLQLARIEFFDVAIVPRVVRDALLELPVPYDIFLAHTDLWPGPASSQMDSAGAQIGAGQPDRATADRLAWRGIVENAERVLVPDAWAEALASSLSLNRGITRVASAAIKPRSLRVRSSVAATRLGLVPIRGCAQESQFMRDIVTGLANLRPGLDIVIVGSTHDDFDLMRRGQAFVTGAVDAAGLHRLFRRYRLDRIVLCMTRPLFDHPLISAAMTSAMPVAFFDWSRGHCPARDCDLPLDPQLPAATVVDRMLFWLEGY
jgi:GT2 family glycosyltransferase